MNNKYTKFNNVRRFQGKWVIDKDNSINKYLSFHSNTK